MDWDNLRRRLSSDEINAMPLCHYEGPIHILRSEDDVAAALPALRRETILGFDTETRPTFRKGKLNPPSLVQMATEDAVYLLQLSWIPLGHDIAALLSDPHIKKVGVAIGDDMKELAQEYPFIPAGIIDLGSMARTAKLRSQGLRTLAAALFGVRISKGPQCSNWSVKVLSQRQVAYAATDAWISREIYLRMCELGLQTQEGTL